MTAVISLDRASSLNFPALKSDLALAAKFKFKRMETDPMRTIAIIILIVALTGCMATTHRGEAIRDLLSETEGLATHNISIDEKTAGFITLNGIVSSQRDRDTIENVARNTKGVKELTSDLVVDPSFVIVREGYPFSSNEQSANEQGAIASEITSKISSSPELRNYHVNVYVVDNAVTLRGEVGSEEERVAAEQIALNTRGVTSLRDDLIIASSARNDFHITQNVMESLGERTDIDLSNVDITTRDAIVTLRGSRYSNHDIKNLISSTRKVAGVRDVRSELTLNRR